MRLHRTLAALATTASLGVVLGGCSGIQESLACPGEDCPASLQAVADGAADVDGVTAVDRTWRFSNIDKGSSGGVDVRASVTTEAEAKPLARAIADLYAASKVETVDGITVHVVPDPELSRPAEGGGATSKGFSEGTDVACAPAACADEVAAFESAFADAPLAGEATLDDAGWAPGAVSPETTLELSVEGQVWDAEEVDAFRDEVFALAEKSGLFDIGNVRTVIHYDEQVDFRFTFDGAGKPSV